METPNSEEQLALEKYRLLVELWMSENPVKTNKLQMLMATNSLLVSAYFLAEPTVWIALVGFVFSLVWVFSIGSTLTYQRHWKSQMEQIRAQYPDITVFQIHSEKVETPAWGGISSRYYTLGTPIATAAGWLSVMAYILLG
jgi:hypothetical protein